MVCIRDFNVPDSCSVCKLISDDGFCMLSGRLAYSTAKRDDGCPLVDIDHDKKDNDMNIHDSFYDRLQVQATELASRCASNITGNHLCEAFRLACELLSTISDMKVEAMLAKKEV